MKMNKLVALLAALCILCGALPMMSLSASAADIVLTDSYKTVVEGWVFGLDNWNVARGAGKIVCYDSRYGKATTGTNKWGIEIAINEYGFVTAIEDRVGNMTIPTNGSVISAHVDNTQLSSMVEKGSIRVGDQLLPAKEGSSQYHVFRVNEYDKLLGKVTDSDVNDKTFAIPYDKLYGGSYKAAFTLGGKGVRTGTNEWNNDVLVKITEDNGDGTYKGYIVKFGGGNIEVPEGYYALTLSGQTIDENNVPYYNYAYLVQQYAPVGSIINCSVKNEAVYVRYDADAAKRAALLMAGETNDVVTETYAYSANTIVTDALTKYELVDTDRMQALYNNMAAIADAVQTMTTNDQLRPYMVTLYKNYEELCKLEFEKRPVEMRAVWVRPLANDFKMRTAAELDAMLEAQIMEQVELGYNQIFIEAFYNSCAIFPVDPSAAYKGLYFSQNPYLVPAGETCGPNGLKGKNTNLTEKYDMLQRFIDICRENNVEPHIWWQVFYVGYERTAVASVDDDLFEYSIAKQVLNNANYPYWNTLDRNEKPYYEAYKNSKGEATTHMYFLNPANEEVHQFLLSMFEYIWTNYDAESFQLDYIRYPKNTGDDQQFGYDTLTKTAFLAKYNQYTETQLMQQSFWANADWIQFRADFVTDFIRKTRALMQEVAPSYYLTSSPAPDPDSAKKHEIQDVETWLKEGLIDVLYPMAYGENVPGMVTPELVANNPDRFVCVGTQASYNCDSYEQRWLKEIRDAGADGIAGFGTIDSWKSYAWSEDAITPTGNATKAASVYLDEVLFARVEKMLAFGDIDADEYDVIEEAVNAASFALNVYGVDSDEAKEAINAVQAVAGSLGKNPKAAITNDVNYILKIRNNSHDIYKNADMLDAMDTTLAINETLVNGNSDDFVFNPSTMTLYVTADNAVISGEMSEDVTVILADGVTDLEFSNVSFASNTFESATALTVYLNGVNRFNGDLPENITYIGTGEIYNGDVLVMCKGDVDGDNDLTSDDLRSLLKYNVKAETYTAEQILVGDVNGDGKINTIDTRSYLNKMINEV